MKKTVLLIFISVILAACGGTVSSSGETDNKKVKIAVIDSKLYNTLVKHVQTNLKEEGINLEIVYMSDWNIFNQALANEEIDLNFFQTKQFLKNANKTNGWNLVPVAETFNNKRGYFSTKYKTIDELPEGATITIPTDPVNNGLSLHVLNEGGLIKLKEGVGFNGSQKDIIENKKNFKIVEVDFNMIPNMLEDSDLSYLTGSTAIEVGLTQEDALVIGDYYEDFTMVLAAREDNKDNELIKRIAKEFESSETQKFLEEKHPNEITWP